MKKPLRVVFLTVLFGIVSLWGGNFWQEKSFSEWDKKEVMRLMTKSPWARTVEFRLGSPMGDFPQHRSPDSLLGPPLPPPVSAGVRLPWQQAAHQAA
jgi:hypothetical protein